MKLCLTEAATCTGTKHPLMQNDNSEHETSSNLPKSPSLNKLVTKSSKGWDGPTQTHRQQCPKEEGRSQAGRPSEDFFLQPRENLSQQTLSALGLHLVWSKRGQTRTRQDTGGSHDQLPWCRSWGLAHCHFKKKMSVSASVLQGGSRWKDNP